MASEALIGIVAAEAKAACKGLQTTEERLRAAMKVAANHWMVLDDEPQFLGAVAAVYALSDDATKERMRSEMAMLRALGAASRGIPVDWEAVAKDAEETKEPPLGLAKLWREIKDAS